MSKIVSAVNAMITNSRNISDVMIGQHGEIFFKYAQKFKWSIRKSDKEIYLWFYPGESDLDALAQYENEEWEGVPIVTYKVSEIGTREATQSFEELHSIIKERLYGVDAVLDEIISGSDDDAKPL